MILTGGVKITATNSVRVILGLLRDQAVGRELHQWKSGVANTLETRYAATRKLFFQNKTTAPYPLYVVTEALWVRA